MDRQEFYEQAENRILALYPQRTFHHNAYIVGGRAGLEALRDAINTALDGDHTMGIGVGLAFAHPSDNETFTTVVIHDFDCDQAEEKDRTFPVTLDDMPCPYFSEKAREAYSDDSVSLVPNERYIMAAGVAHHILNEELKAADEATVQPEATKQSKAKKRGKGK